LTAEGGYRPALPGPVAGGANPSSCFILFEPVSTGFSEFTERWKKPVETGWNHFEEEGERVAFR